MYVVAHILCVSFSLLYHSCDILVSVYTKGNSEVENPGMYVQSAWSYPLLLPESLTYTNAPENIYRKLELKDKLIADRCCNIEVELPVSFLDVLEICGMNQ